MTFAAPSPSLSSNDKLTDEDKQLLVSGELVVKQKSEQQGSLKAVADLSRYKRFIPLATDSFVQHQAGNEAELAMRQQWGPIDVRYVFQTTLDPDGHSMVFRVDHSQAHDIRAGWGFIKVRPFKGNRSLVSFGALVDIGDGVFVSIIRPAVRKDLLRIPFYFKRHLEGDGRMLYIGGGP
ncbi:MAG: hypothetical protein JRJ80_10795 [Deltaproteobacteria bacterium]|nr:hypothetical protein [Deltaproteobacteria bacterium]